MVAAIKITDILEITGPIRKPIAGRQLLYAAKTINPKYVKHALKSHLLHHGDVYDRVIYSPTCRACERVAVGDVRLNEPKGMVTCPICGYHGPPGPPVSMAALGLNLPR